MQTPSSSLKRGYVLRKDEDQLLKTAIVASIGKPEKYPPEGIVELPGKERPDQITYGYLVHRFYECGVDIIRLNLSHFDVREISGVFLTIKRAIIECEGTSGARKRIAVLADLPGPKIRLHLQEGINFTVGQEFTVHFRETTKTEHDATVYIDRVPLEQALARNDNRTLLHTLDLTDDPEIIENVLGGLAMHHPRKPESYQEMLKSIGSAANSEYGLRVVLGDGEVVLEAPRTGMDIDNTCLKCRVVSKRGDQFKESLGFTVKGLSAFTDRIPSFTNEDSRKVTEILKADYDDSGGLGTEPVVAFVGLSFVQTADDVLRARRFIEDKLKRLGKNKTDARLHAPALIAKIETKKGLKNRRYIIDVADGIMVARGDLGLQMEIEKVPAEQKKLINLCNKRGKPAITATEMLKSMTKSDEPTRAEGTDVFNAIVEGSDAVMMSEETSSGRYPFHAIQKMIAVATEAERFYEYQGLNDDKLARTKSLARIDTFLQDDIARIDRNDRRFGAICSLLDERKVKTEYKSGRLKRLLPALKWRHAIYHEKWEKTKNQLATNLITQAACKMSESQGVRCILAASTSGRTVRMISRLRPSVVIVGAAHDPINARKLAISYGVLPICMPEISDKLGPDEVFEECQKLIASSNFLSERLRLLTDAAGPCQVIFTAGTPLKRPGTTNLIQTRELNPAAKGKKSKAAGSV